MGKDVASGRGINIQQPYVEEILLGKKKFEYRSRPTKIVSASSAPLFA